MPGAPVPLRPVLVALLACLAALLAAGPAGAVVPGVQTHLLWSSVDAAGVEEQLDEAQAIGARMVRVDVGWSSLEGEGKGRWSSWHLARLDNVVTQAERRGIGLLLTFWETPCWASSAPASLRLSCSGRWWDRGVQRYAPNDPRDYADALRHLARRYGSRVAGWEVWNEPNAESFWRAADPVGQYVALLRAAYPAVKAVAPSVPVVGGSLMYADEAWTRAAYAAGVKGAFDAWSVHPYSEDRSPLAPAPGAEWRKLSFAEGVPAIRQTLLEQGDDKPLWLTEVGWHTSTTRGAAAWRNGVDLARQATFTAEALAKAAEWPWVHAVIAFGLRDTSTDPTFREGNFGLHTIDGTPKPAAAAFRSAAGALSVGLPAAEATSWAAGTLRAARAVARRAAARRAAAPPPAARSAARRAALRRTVARRCARPPRRASRSARATALRRCNAARRALRTASR
jgi:polysaccharide biosynthesis protein PslG